MAVALVSVAFGGLVAFLFWWIQRAIERSREAREQMETTVQDTHERVILMAQQNEIDHAAVRNRVSKLSDRVDGIAEDVTDIKIAQAEAHGFGLEWREWRKRLSKHLGDDVQG